MAKARWFGINAPFLGGAQNVLTRQEDERLIKNDLLQLLLTAPGERVMRPDFGTQIRPSLFDLSDQGTIDALNDNIREQIERFERRVTATDIITELDSDENLLTIKVFGFLNIDRFGQVNQFEGPEEADLLVELELPTGGV